MTTALAEPDPTLVAAAAPEPPPEPQHPHPARYRRLKRIVVIAAVFLAGMLTVRLWWGREAARRLAAEVQAIRARGEPILPDDFAPDEVPDPQDAVAAYQRAMGTVAFTGSQEAFRQQFDEIVPFSASARRQVKGVLDKNAAVLQQVRTARTLTRYRSGTLWTPVYSTRLGRVWHWGRLAGLLKWQALYDHEAGDDAGAIEALRDAPPLATAADHEFAMLLQHNAAEGIDWIAGVAPVFQVAHDLAVEGDTASSAGLRQSGTPTHLASRVQVEALIAALLDDAWMRQGMVRAIWGHRMMVLDAGPGSITGLPPAMGWFLRPSADLDMIRVARRRGQVAEAGAEPDYPDARAKFPPPDPLAAPGRASTLEHVARLPSHLFDWKLEPYLVRHYQHLAERRMAAVALAIRLYRADHAGRWPESLGDLVPAYLPSVPIDPFAAGGKPLRYLPNALGWEIPPALAAAESSYVPAPGTGPFLGGPAVYSVGADGIDDGGSRRLRPNLHRQHTFSFNRADWQDLVIPLAGNPEARNPDRSGE